MNKKGVIIGAFIFLILIVLFYWRHISIYNLLINTTDFATKFLLPWFFLYWFIKLVNVLEKQGKS